MTDADLLKTYGELFDHLDSCNGITLDFDDIMGSGEFTEDEARRVIILRG
jgi:hypothetical protein